MCLKDPVVLNTHAIDLLANFCIQSQQNHVQYAKVSKTYILILYCKVSKTLISTVISIWVLSEKSLTWRRRWHLGAGNMRKKGFGCVRCFGPTQLLGLKTAHYGFALRRRSFLVCVLRISGFTTELFGFTGFTTVLMIGRACSTNRTSWAVRLFWKIPLPWGLWLSWGSIWSASRPLSPLPGHWWGVMWWPLSIWALLKLRRSRSSRNSVIPSISHGQRSGWLHRIIILSMTKYIQVCVCVQCLSLSFIRRRWFWVTTSVLLLPVFFLQCLQAIGHCFDKLLPLRNRKWGDGWRQCYRLVTTWGSNQTGIQPQGRSDCYR